MSRSAGLVLAALAGTASISVLVWFSLLGGEQPPRTGTSGDIPGPPPDLRQGARASDVTIDIADKNDPSRRSGYIRAKSTQQMENRQVKMVSPEMWHFPRSGRLARITADEAEAYIPSEQPGSRPERAVMRGNAELRLFDPKAGDAPGTTTIDPTRDHAWLVAKTPIMYYDGPLGEVTLPDELDIQCDAFTFRARNATMRFSDAEQRLEFLRIEEAASPLIIQSNAKWDAPSGGTPATPSTPRTETSVLPPRSEPNHPRPLATPGAPSPASPSNPAPGEATPKTPSMPVEAFYRLVIESPVTVAQGGRSIAADRLEAWMRLVDNKLPATAVGTPKAKDDVAPADLPKAPAGDVGAPAPTEPATTMTLPADGTGDRGEPILITWTGPLEVRPLAESPVELEGTDIALRFTASADRLVTFRDEKSGASGSAPEVRYAVTPREITLLTQAPDQVVRLSMPGSGEAVVQRVSIGIGTGRVVIAGAGALQGEVDTHAGDDPAHAGHDHNTRNLTWIEGAEFVFAVENGRITSKLVSSTLVGGIGAGDRNGRLGADRLDASFVPDPANSDQTLLSTITLTGSASLADFSGGALSADTINVAFDLRPGGGDSDPALLTAMGGVSGFRQGSTLSADFLQASLVRKDNANDVDQVVAKGNISFAGPSAIFAGGDELQAVPRLEIVDLTGTSAFVGQRQTQVNGTHIHIEGGPRQIRVVGPGSFEHQDLQDGGVAQRDSDRGRVTVAWTTGMTFDDLAGHVTCDGGVRMVWEQGPLQRDTLDAERVAIWVTPQQRPSSASPFAVDPSAPPMTLPSAEGDSGPLGDRVLLRAVAFGAGTIREKGGPVKVDSRRFVPRGDGEASDAIERLLYLEGLEIHVDNEASTLTVPIAGRMFVLDQRERQAAAKANSDRSVDPLSQLADSSGEALFRWGGSLVANRSDGTLTMTKDVSMRHRRLEDDNITELTAATEVRAKLSKSDPASTGPKRKPGAIESSLGQLEWATAKGSAWLANQGRQVQADELLYNASVGEVDATSGEGSNVTLLEPQSGTPLTARRILWNLKTGRIEVKQPGTIVAPR
jgi:hypothetical protein